MKKYLLSAVLVFSLLIFNQAHAGKYNAVISIGDAMPSFSQLPSLEGMPVSSSDFEGKIVVIMSLANHCPWVKGTDQDIIKTVNQFKDKDVAFLGFCVNHLDDDRLPAIKAHAAKVGYNFNYVYDETQALGRKLGATRTPEFFVFDQSHKLAYMGLLHNSPAKMNRDGSLEKTNGDATEFYVANALNELLSNQPVSKKETRAHGCSVKYVKVKDAK